MNMYPFSVQMRCQHGLCQWTWPIGVSWFRRSVSLSKSLTDEFAADYLGFDIMMELVFGSDVDALGNSTDREMIEAIEQSNVRTGTLLYVPELIFGRLDKILFPHAVVGRNKFIRFVSRVVEDRIRQARTDPLHRVDVFGIMSTWKDVDMTSDASVEELSAECTTLIVAGGFEGSVVDVVPANSVQALIPPPLLLRRRSFISLATLKHTPAPWPKFRLPFPGVKLSGLGQR